MLEDNSTIIDVGCDHGLLDIYAVKNLKNVKCIASDINENALSMAVKNINKYKVNDKIKTVVSNGIEKIDIDNNSIIVISGMGTNTILEILKNKKSLLAKKIIIQSNNHLYELRSEMIKKGYIITNEKVIFEKGKYYVVIAFKKGKTKYTKFELTYGPLLLKDISNKDYFIHLIQKEKFKLKKIPKKYIFFRIKTIYNINKIMDHIK